MPISKEGGMILEKKQERPTVGFKDSKKVGNVSKELFL